jgi:asparagine synthetase B (glutamine-hydrolysing)
MGAIAAFLSAAPPVERERRLRAMADMSLYRGALRWWHFADVSLSLQARDSEATARETDARLVLVHGRPYLAGADDREGRAPLGGELVAELLEEHGLGGLSRLDGEYALLVHDKQDSVTFACVSLMITKPLYVARGRLAGGPCLVLASEVRQVASGAGVERRLDPEQLVQSLCFNGPILDRSRTEYRGIDRLLAPTVYRLCPRKQEPKPMFGYWTPPEEVAARQLAPSEHGARLLHTLRVALRAAPAGSALSLSGGYDSGCLWAAAYADRARWPMPEAVTISFPGRSSDQTPLVKELLGQTNLDGRFVDGNAFIVSTEKMAAYPDSIDRLPLTAEVHVAQSFARALRQYGFHAQILGLGAEATVLGNLSYLADFVRHGDVVGCLRDIMRIDSYYMATSTAVQRLRLFWRSALAPPGSWLRRLRNGRLPLPVARCWVPQIAAARHLLDGPVREHGFGRGHKLQTLLYGPLVAGNESNEQINEREGVEPACPYYHRAVVSLGFELSARQLACGSHEKALMRVAATQALGADPPWPLRKLPDSFDAAALCQAIRDLGPAQRWALVAHGILSPEGTERLRSGADRGAATVLLGRAAVAEYFVRRFGT